jgi:ribosomal protein L29
MNKLYCECGKVVRSGRKFKTDENCPDCGKPLGIIIKGRHKILDGIPSDVVKIPRRMRPFKKDGSSKSHGAGGTLPPEKRSFGLPNVNEIGQMTDDEIATLLKQCDGKLMTQQGKVTRGDLPDNISIIRQTKRTKARLLTEIGKRRLAGATV